MAVTGETPRLPAADVGESMRHMGWEPRPIPVIFSVWYCLGHNGPLALAAMYTSMYNAQYDVLGTLLSLAASGMPSTSSTTLPNI